MRKLNRKNRAEPWFGLEEDKLRSEATACALLPQHKKRTVLEVAEGL